MSLLFAEGAGVDMTNWDSNSCSRNTSPLGRYGDTGIIGHGDTGNTVAKNITASSQVFVGVAQYLVTNSPNGGNRIIQLYDVNGVVHLYLRLITINTYGIFRGDGTQLGSTITTTTTTMQNSWNYWEMTGTIADAGGICIVRRNNVEVINFTGDTKNGGTSTNWGTVAFTGSGGSAASYTDDIYICNSAGSAPNNTFLGEIRVLPSLSTGAGSSTQLTPTGSANNWDNVNDTATDSTYNGHATAGQRDTYAMADISTSYNVFGVQITSRMIKSDAGVASMKAAIKSGSTVAYGTTRALLASATTYQDLWETDPNTAAAWTASGFNSLEVGAEVA